MARLKKACNFLLSFYERPIPYVEFDVETYSDRENTDRMTDILNQVINSLETNVPVDIEGVTFTVNGTGVLLDGTAWIAIEPYGSYDVLAAENWMNGIALTVQATNPTWKIMPSRTARGYFGFKFTKNF